MLFITAEVSFKWIFPCNHTCIILFRLKASRPTAVINYLVYRITWNRGANTKVPSPIPDTASPLAKFRRVRKLKPITTTDALYVIPEPAPARETVHLQYDLNSNSKFAFKLLENVQPIDALDFPNCHMIYCIMSWSIKWYLSRLQQPRPRFVKCDISVVASVANIRTSLLIEFFMHLYRESDSTVNTCMCWCAIQISCSPTVSVVCKQTIIWKLSVSFLVWISNVSKLWT
jgi:hypothetical protein